MERKAIIKGALIGIGLFIITQVLLRLYAVLIMKLVPSGTPMTAINSLLTSTVNIVYWICMPLSRLFWIFGKDFIHSSYSLTQHSVLISRGLDLIFWVGISVLILYIRRKK